MIESPLRYQGSKRKLIQNILKECPKHSRFVDVFGGSGVVSANMGSKFRYYNELDQRVFDMIFMLARNDPRMNIKNIRKWCERYELSRDNNDGYLALRDAYNERPTPTKLFVLHRHSHSNLIRHNQKGMFNASFGKRQIDFDLLEEEVHKFYESMQSVKFLNMDYIDVFKKFSKRMDKRFLFYLDPPYLASGEMQYSGGWTEQQEKFLLKSMEVILSKGAKVMLSNVLRHRSFKNQFLIDWIERNNVIVRNLNMKYKFARAYDTEDNGTQEILLIGGKRCKKR